jgi:hypothetical protein
MTVGNERKAAQLGMAISTALHRLKKVILFDLARELRQDCCYHCGRPIEDVEQFSIEHKVGWLYEDAALFWDLSNITFSHLRCNTTTRITPQYDRGGSIGERKAARLGMAPGTAMARLRVLVMLDLLARLGRDACYRCGERIATAEELSVEHKVAWLDNDPQLFWDRANIAFSHRRCNSRAASRTRQGESTGGRYRKVGPEGTAWCGSCRAFLPGTHFRQNRSHWNGLHFWCKGCERKSRRSGDAA